MTTQELKARCAEYRQNLYEAFRYLAGNATVSRYCRAMTDSCSRNRDTLQRAKTGNQHNWSVDIQPNWIIEVEDKMICGMKGDTFLSIGGQVSVNERIPQVIQSVAVCVLLTPRVNINADHPCNGGLLRQGEPVVVRRFHFDYDVTVQANEGHRPRAHLQYGGKLRPDFDEVGTATYHLFSKLEVPRIPYAPYDPILVLDLFLRQFKTPLTEVIEDGTWSSVVHKSETLWIKGYYDEINGHFGKASRETLHRRQNAHIDWLNP